MSSKLIGELGQVVGMGLDGGLVHCEVVVMGEEMVVSSGTAVYQEQVPGVISTYNDDVLKNNPTAEQVGVEQQPAAVDFGNEAPAGLSHKIITSSEVADSDGGEGGNKRNRLNQATRMSLEEVGSNPNTAVVEGNEEEVCCGGDDDNVADDDDDYDDDDRNVTKNKRMPTTISGQSDFKSESSNDSLITSAGKEYALPPDPGTATRRGGPGPTKRHSQRYRKAWEQLPEFKDWLTSHHNVYRAVCKICNKILLADFTVLTAHATAQKHMMLVDRLLKAKRLSTRKANHNSAVHSTSSENTSLMGNAGGDDDYDRVMTDNSKNNSGGSGVINQSDNTDGNYSQSVFVQHRNTPGPSQVVSKAVVMSPAPNWKATAIVNGHVTRLDLSDYIGRYLILVFYPQDFSKICASEINALSDRSFEFRSIQTEIVACSVDSHLSHLTWSKLSRADGGVSLPKIPLIADPTHTIARAYGVFLPDKGHTLRAHFIIDKRGILRHSSVTDTLVGRGTDELFRLVKALQYVDEVEEPVPADWTDASE